MKLSYGPSLRGRSQCLGEAKQILYWRKSPELKLFLQTRVLFKIK